MSKDLREELKKSQDLTSRRDGYLALNSNDKYHKNRVSNNTLNPSVTKNILQLTIFLYQLNCVLSSLLSFVQN